MRYRITFSAREDNDFNWSVNEVSESNELLELIFTFQIWIAKEFRRIVEESRKVLDDDIPF